MKRAMFEVTINEGERDVTYCANHLSCYDGQAGRQAIAFISSGRLLTFPVEKVVSIKVGDSYSHCNECDGSVAAMGYYPHETVRAQA